MRRLAATLSVAAAIAASALGHQSKPADTPWGAAQPAATGCATPNPCLDDTPWG
jgi:hypothetical protein